MTKQLILTTAAVMAAMICRGEAQRTVRSLENKFPTQGQLELGVNFRSYQFDDEGDSSLNSVGAVARYGLLKNLTAYIEAPAAVFKTDIGDDGEGVGDLRGGLQLKAYEDVFEYPWIVPHFDFTVSTGNDDEGLGTGEGSYAFGISIGSRMYDTYGFVLDGTHVLNGGYQTGSMATEDATVLSLSITADVSEQLAFVVEGSLVLVDDDDDDEDFFSDESSDDPVYVGAGMVYRWSERLTIGGNIGSWSDAQFDTELSVRAGYDF